MPLVQKDDRFSMRVARALECYHVRDSERCLTTLTVLQHDLTAAQFAAALRQAADWFDKVAADAIPSKRLAVSLQPEQQQGDKR